MGQLLETLRPVASKRSIHPTPPWGFFDLDAHEYVLNTPFAPRPWKNILWNGRYNAQPTQHSGGISYYRYNDGTIVLLNWTGEKYFYLLNTQTGECFCPSVSPMGHKDFDFYEHRVGLRTSTTTIEQYGLRVVLIHSVDASQPREYYEVVVLNRGGDTTTWRVVFFTDLHLRPEKSEYSLLDRFEAKTSQQGHRLILNNRNVRNGTHAAFLECTQAFDGAAFNREDFTGIYGSLNRPDAVLEGWPTAHTPVESPILAGYVDCPLQPGQSESLLFTLGLPDKPGIALDALPVVRFSDVAYTKATQNERLEELYGRLDVQTPDATFNLYVNTWIKHQLHYCAYWNRGWGKGFRDGNQDAWAYTLLDPERAREMILDCLPYQFADGRTVRSWGPINRKPYNDGGTWLIFATHAYLAESGDLTTLDHIAPFFESEETGTLYEHLCRVIDYLWENRGDRGLCLMPYGDWNDRLTGIGKDGKGQSVWTSMALVASLHRMEEIAQLAGKKDEAYRFSKQAAELTELVRKEAWNGQWFSRAFTDDGTPVGAPTCDEGSIYLLPQAWSILAGITTDEQIPQLIEAVETNLQTVHGFRLLTPPYQDLDERIGLLSATQPGRLENGGNYCHGTMFMAYALCLAEQRDKALTVLKDMLPNNPDNPLAVSRQEPYSLTNSYCAPESGDLSGRSHFSWRTGTAGWAFRTAIEGIMGVKAGIGGLEIRGELPHPDWKQASLKRTMRGKVLQIEWEKTGTASRLLNGVPVDDTPLNPDEWPTTENILQITF